MRILGVIPARGGSKGVPRKNIRALGATPLIGHTVHAAVNAKSLTLCVVSTDDDEIAAISTKLGGLVPFKRPAELATDDALAIPVLIHALETIEEDREIDPFEAVMMLQPTTPFRRSTDIDGAIALLKDTKADSVISVVEVGGHHPARMKYLEEDRLIDPPFCEKYENQPRQELTPMYLRNGAIYLAKRDVLLSGSLKGRDCRAWIMTEQDSINIDTERDFQLAEWSYNQFHSAS